MSRQEGEAPGERAGRVTKEEAIRNAGRIYGQILADPERAAQIRVAMEKYDAEHPVERE